MGEVLFSAYAGARLRTHEEYLRARNPKAADRFATEVARVVALLREHPRTAAPVEGKPYRSFVTRRYRLVYLVQGEDVRIIDVLHSRQAGPS